MKLSKSSILVGHFVAILTLSLPSVAQSGSGAGSVSSPIDVTDVPSELRLTGMPGRIRVGYQSAGINLSASKRTVELRWVSDLYQNQEPNPSVRMDWATKTKGGSIVNQQVQTISVQFYPTACAKIDDSSILVSGMKPSNGADVVQKWTFSWAGGLPSPYVNSNGYDEVDISIPNVSKSTVYLGADPKIATWSTICGIAVLRKSIGLPQEAVIMFRKPSELALLDLNSGGLRLLAGSSVNSGPFASVSSLGQGQFSGIRVKDHVADGFVYRLLVGRSEFASMPGATDVTELLLIDSNRDGALDSFKELSPAAYEAQGYGDLNNYKEWWKE